MDHAIEYLKGGNEVQPAPDEVIDLENETPAPAQGESYFDN